MSVQTKIVEYNDGDQVCVGLLAWDDAWVKSLVS